MEGMAGPTGAPLPDRRVQVDRSGVDPRGACRGVQRGGSPEMIYFAQLPTGAIKIGTTEGLDHRLQGLGTHYGKPVALLGTMPGGREAEREIHRRFAHLRIRRSEQFR